MKMTEFEYYYGTDAEQFNFFRLPKKLIRDKQFEQLSSDAKILYGVLLDRMTLSIKNKWLDEENRIYIIYTIEEIAEEFSCSKRKAIMLLNDLERNGLLEKKRQGLGKPNLLYVKNFNQKVEVKKSVYTPKKEKQGERRVFSEVQEYAPQEVKECAFQEVQEYAPQEVQQCAFQEVQNPTPQEVKAFTPQNNKTDYNQNIYNLSIHQSKKEGWIDRSMILKTVRGRTEYDILVHDCPTERNRIDEIIELITDILCYKGTYLTVNGAEIRREEVQDRFKKLNMRHIRYVLNCLNTNGSKIRNIRSYLITCLYNAPVTIDTYYYAQVQRDMYLGKI